MTWVRLMYLAIVGVNVIAGTIVLIIAQLVTFPALGLAWAPVHAFQAAGLLTLSALARGTLAWLVRRIDEGRSA
ncbi:hypothetical protein [Defluviimonas sp. SAOS-178_SWC]|uniref:hypothetical protein n=1 Tax=Defluviimonas sp. SAOS-178_SWC TaxID=3121287 RepID=UPI0032219E56